ncbi:hypothetical protein C4X99_15265 [Leptospira interrogans serovar Geyaweera]|nr:hypothetical protein C4X99_15265 [Leptospira interrogans serovar Geyaweera]
MIESNAKRMMYKEIQQNAFYHNQPHKLKRVLKSKLNSAERFLKLSVSLLLALDRSRLNSAERSLRIAFYIETKDKISHYISFM